MTEKLLRRREVEDMTGFSRSAIYRKIAERLFPRPVKIGSTAVRWRQSDIEAWMASLPDSGGEYTTGGTQTLPPITESAETS